MLAEAQQAFYDWESIQHEAVRTRSAAQTALRQMMVYSPTDATISPGAIRQLEEASRTQSNFQRATHEEGWEEAILFGQRTVSEILRALNAISMARGQAQREVEEAHRLMEAAQALRNEGIGELENARSIVNEILPGQPSRQELPEIPYSYSPSSDGDQILPPTIDEREVDEPSSYLPQLEELSYCQTGAPEEGPERKDPLHVPTQGGPTQGDNADAPSAAGSTVGFDSIPGGSPAPSIEQRYIPRGNANGSMPKSPGTALGGTSEDISEEGIKKAFSALRNSLSSLRPAASTAQLRVPSLSETRGQSRNGKAISPATYKASSVADPQVPAPKAINHLQPDNGMSATPPSTPRKVALPMGQEPSQVLRPAVAPIDSQPVLQGLEIPEALSMDHIDANPQVRTEVRQPETQPERRNFIGPAAASQLAYDNPDDLNRYEVQQPYPEVASSTAGVGPEEVYQQISTPQVMSSHKLHAQDPQALEEPAQFIPETYTGTFKVEFIPTLDMDKLGFYWQVLDDVAGVGKVMDAQPTDDGFEFTLELGNDQLRTEDLRNAIPNTRLEVGEMTS